MALHCKENNTKLKLDNKLGFADTQNSPKGSYGVPQGLENNDGLTQRIKLCVYQNKRLQSRSIKIKTAEKDMNKKRELKTQERQKSNLTAIAKVSCYVFLRP